MKSLFPSRKTTLNSLAFSTRMMLCLKSPSPVLRCLAAHIWSSQTCALSFRSRWRRIHGFRSASRTWRRSVTFCDVSLIASSSPRRVKRATEHRKEGITQEPLLGEGGGPMKLTKNLKLAVPLRLLASQFAEGVPLRPCQKPEVLHPARPTSRWDKASHPHSHSLYRGRGALIDRCPTFQNPCLYLVQRNLWMMTATWRKRK